MRQTASTYGVLCVLLMTLAGCNGNRDQKTLTFDPNIDVFGSQAETGTLARTMRCTSTASDGSCNQRECKQGEGGFTYDCASYAAACVRRGYHWSGTKEGGKCSRIL